MISHTFQNIKRVTETETWTANKGALFYFSKLTLQMIFSSAHPSFSHQHSKTQESGPDHHFNLQGKEEEEEERGKTNSG